MADWRAELERERHTRVSPPPADAASSGPTRTYADWVRDRSCGDKRAYGHQLEARDAILQIAKKRGPQLVEYRCEYCGLWHLTSKIDEEKTA